jgi:hypothetical protein
VKFPDIGGQSGGSKSGLFVRLKDGEKAVGVFKGDPSIFRIHWKDGKSTVCTGKGSCHLCAQPGDEAKPKFRFRLNFITKDEGVWVAKIFEGNYGTFKDLKEMHEQSYALPETLVTISRSGEKQNTRYLIMPVKNNGGLNATEFGKLDRIPLNDLSPVLKQPDSQVPADEGEDFGAAV